MNTLAVLLVLLSVYVQPVASQAHNVPHGRGNCNDDWDCSLGGVCTNSQCVCDPWFTGNNCDLLNLQPGTLSNGLNLADKNFSSWGGHSIKEDDGYHGFFSFICDHQTLGGGWETVSSVVHAVAELPEGPYTVKDLAVQPWAHNAMITKDPTNGDYVLFHIGSAKTDPSVWEPCINGTQGEAEKLVKLERSGKIDATVHDATGLKKDFDFGVYVHTAPGPNGPWTSHNNGTALPVDVTGWWGTNITNPTPFIFPNGTTILAVAANDCPEGWGAAPNCVGLLRADHWSGPYAPFGHNRPVVHPESEDPFMWQDHRGAFHLFTNVNTYHKRCAAGEPCGGHAWSYDAIEWSEQTIGAFGPVIRHSDGVQTAHSYIERPQITQDDKTKIPLTFFTGMSASGNVTTNYGASISWAQKFCTADLDPEKDCGPTTYDWPEPFVPKNKTLGTK